MQFHAEQRKEEMREGCHLNVVSQHYTNPEWSLGRLEVKREPLHKMELFHYNLSDRNEVKNWTQRIKGVWPTFKVRSGKLM